MEINRKQALIAGAAALVAVAGGGFFALDSTEPVSTPEEVRTTRVLAQQLKSACGSQATYDRLKQVAFDEAIQAGSADPENLDVLSTHALVRVENPVVKSRDETLDITQCEGRFILEVPPGAERAFNGQRRLTANIEYAAQAAADGSGMVYQLRGAEPIIASLARFDLQSREYRPIAAPTAAPALADAAPVPAETPEQVAVAPAPPPLPPPPRAAQAPIARAAPTAAPRPAAPPRVAPAPPPVQRAASTAPSFSCRSGRSRSEQMVCNNDRLASLDREMSSQFYSELSRGDDRVRAALRQSRDRFLSYRERCDDESCVEQAYRDRMDEIADIASR